MAEGPPPLPLPPAVVPLAVFPVAAVPVAVEEGSLDEEEEEDDAADEEDGVAEDGAVEDAVGLGLDAAAGVDDAAVALDVALFAGGLAWLDAVPPPAPVRAPPVAGGSIMAAIAGLAAVDTVLPASGWLPLGEASPLCSP